MSDLIRVVVLLPVVVVLGYALLGLLFGRNSA